LGVLLFAGAWIPGPDVAARPDPDVAALVVALLPDPDVAPLIVASLPRTDVAPLIIAALPNPDVGAPGDADIKVNPREARDECSLEEACVDQYLWAVYERAPKVDTIKVSEKRKVTVKKKGKSRTFTKTFTKLVAEDFTWKDPKAAERAGMSMIDYVIGGMDRSFKLKLYTALRAMDDASLVPGITSGFRDDYRQSIASGNKAATDSSFHGGSRRGGYGHGLAADLVSVKGKTRSERWVASEALWKWIDAHGKEFGVGRPYLDRDPPHVAPMDGREYAAKRGLRDWVAVFSDQKRKRLTAKGSRSTKRAKTTKSSKVAAARDSAKPAKVQVAQAGAKSAKATAVRSSSKSYSVAGSSPPVTHTVRVAARPR